MNNSLSLLGYVVIVIIILLIFALFFLIRKNSKHTISTIFNPQKKKNGFDVFILIIISVSLIAILLAVTILYWVYVRYLLIILIIYFLFFRKNKILKNITKVSFSKWSFPKWLRWLLILTFISIMFYTNVYNITNEVITCLGFPPRCTYHYKKGDHMRFKGPEGKTVSYTGDTIGQNKYWQIRVYNVNTPSVCIIIRNGNIISKTGTIYPGTLKIEMETDVSLSVDTYY